MSMDNARNGTPNPQRLVGTLRDALFISPHFDDAVFSCGAFIGQCRRAVVVTVFGGAPVDGSMVTEWDSRCGFRDAHHALVTRRAEDAEALRVLGAEGAWLPFCDAQYGQALDEAALFRALRQAFLGAALPALIFPLGLFHADHRATWRACMALAARNVHLLAFEDAIYRRIPGQVQSRIVELAASGLVATPVTLPGDAGGDLKRHAARCYRSQWKAFPPGGLDDLADPERYWLIERSDGP